MKGELYNDLHPETSLKNTGFKDKSTAIKTIKLVEKRCLRYQFDVINTMYNRAKYHPSQTKEMKEAMKVFHDWLKNYKRQKEKQDHEYPFLPYKTILQYEALADEYGVSEVARGLKKGTKTDKGFLQVLKELKGKENKLQYIPVKDNKPNGMDYYSYRINFIKSRLGQMKKSKDPFFYKDGKYKGLPTKQHIILIMHSFSPYPDKLLSLKK